MVVSKNLEMRLMDVVLAYLYGSLDFNNYMKIPEGLKIPETYTSRNLYSIKLQRSLYGLKQSGRIWYNRLSEYLIKEGYKNDPLCPCVFIKKSESGFAIVAVYVDDINIIGTPEELTKTVEYLKREFKVKDLGKTKLCLGLELEHKTNGIFVHQSAYTKRILEHFNMDKSHPLTTPMVVKLLEPHKDMFNTIPMSSNWLRTITYQQIYRKWDIWSCVLCQVHQSPIALRYSTSGPSISLSGSLGQNGSL